MKIDLTFFSFRGIDRRLELGMSQEEAALELGMAWNACLRQ